MKKLLALLLALMCLTGAASAETLRLFDVSPTDAFRASHTDVTVITNRDADLRLFYYGMELNNQLLSGSFQWDAFEVPSTYANLPLLYEKGYLLDLSGSEVIRDLIARVHPDIAALCTYDGHIYGVPTYIMAQGGLPKTVWPEMWLSAGYTQEDIPQTFGAYLDFIDGWLDRREDDPNLTLNVFAQYEPTNYDIHSYSGRLVDELLDSYIDQTLYAGKPLRFDDPELIPLLDKARVVGERVFTYEPTKTDSNSNYGLFGGAIGELEYSQLEAWQVDLRIHEDQPTIMRFLLHVSGVYAGTANPELAIAAVEDYALDRIHDERSSLFHAQMEMLFMDAQPVRNEQYDRVMRLDQNRLSMCEHQLNGDDTPYTAYVDMTDLDAYRDSLAIFASKLQTMKESELRDEIAGIREAMAEYQAYEYTFSPEDLAAWKQYAQHLYFPGPYAFTTDEGYANFQKLKKQFVDGLIDARQLANELDRIAWMMEMENQ